MRAGRWIERIAWVAGIALLGGYAAARLSFENARVAAVEGFEARAAAAQATPLEEQTAVVPAAASPPATPADRLAPVTDTSLWSQQRIRAFRASLGNAGPVLGVLRMPSVALEVPVYAEITEASLNSGAAHVAGTSAVAGTGNFGLASHRDGYFRKLEDVAIGDALELETAGGTLVFDVVGLAVVAPDETGVLAAGETPSVTLVTCYPFYFAGRAPRRYVVRAELRTSVRAGTPTIVDSSASSSRRGNHHAKHQ